MVMNSATKYIEAEGDAFEVAFRVVKEVITDRSYDDDFNKMQ